MVRIDGRSGVLLGTILFAVITVGAYAVYKTFQQSKTETSVVEHVIRKLGQEVGNHPEMKLKDGLMLPTNNWYGSLVFSEDPLPIFAHPLIFRPTATGFEMGVPGITSTRETLFGSHAPSLTVDLQSTQYRFAKYDDLSVTIEYLYNRSSPLATVKITRGSPYVFVALVDDTKVTVKSQKGFTQSGGSSLYATPQNDKPYSYAVKTSEKSELQNGSINSQAKKNSMIALFATLEGDDLSRFSAGAESPIEKTEVSYELSIDAVRTKFRVITTDNKPTIFSSLPHHAISSPEILQANYESLYGRMIVNSGNEFISEQPLRRPPVNLSLTNLSKENSSALISQVKADIAQTTPLQKTDTYFGGKELYRAANLLMLAQQLNLQDDAKIIYGKLSPALDDWLDLKTDSTENSRYFYYDTTIKGLVGVEPSFGSEEFNDHHFHYGYFIYAASIAAQYDKGFLMKHKNTIDTLIADIASLHQSESLPRLRSFDTYMVTVGRLGMVILEIAIIKNPVQRL